jgi:DpnII restriction endonuclease
LVPVNAPITAIITDAKSAFSRQIEADASRDPLVGAFAVWLGLPLVNLPSLLQCAQSAAQTKGAARTYRDVAILGFAVTDADLRNKYGGEFCALLVWLMGRPIRLSGGDPTPMLADPVAVLGIIQGGEAYLSGEDLGRFANWARQVLTESLKVVGNFGWLGGFVASLVANTPLSPEFEWVGAGLRGRLHSFAKPKPDLAQIIQQVVTGTDLVKSGAEAALRASALRWACRLALDVNIGSVAIEDVGQILGRVGTIFSRWVWEDKPRTSRRNAEARRWHIENEYHFQSLLFAVLKPVLPELDEEQYLESTGQLQPRADLCLMSLGLLIEVKFWYRRDSANRLIEEVTADVTLYLKSKAPYSALIVAIWDDGARTEEHAELARGLRGLAGIRDVIIVSKPSRMSDSA